MGLIVCWCNDPLCGLESFDVCNSWADGTWKTRSQTNNACHGIYDFHGLASSNHLFTMQKCHHNKKIKCNRFACNITALIGFKVFIMFQFLAWCFLFSSVVSIVTEWICSSLNSEICANFYIKKRWKQQFVENVEEMKMLLQLYHYLELNWNSCSIRWHAFSYVFSPSNMYDFFPHICVWNELAMVKFVAGISSAKVTYHSADATSYSRECGTKCET